jgi:hypothetical protein
VASSRTPRASLFPCAERAPGGLGHQHQHLVAAAASGIAPPQALWGCSRERGQGCGGARRPGIKQRWPFNPEAPINCVQVTGSIGAHLTTAGFRASNWRMHAISTLCTLFKDQAAGVQKNKQSAVNC